MIGLREPLTREQLVRTISLVLGSSPMSDNAQEEVLERVKEICHRRKTGGYDAALGPALSDSCLELIARVIAALFLDYQPDAPVEPIFRDAVRDEYEMRCVLGQGDIIEWYG